MAELLRARTASGVVVVTETHVVLEGYQGTTRTIPRASITSIESKPAIRPVLGHGGSKQITIHAQGAEAYIIRQFPWKQADELVRILN